MVADSPLMSAPKSTRAISGPDCTSCGRPVPEPTSFGPGQAAVFWRAVFSGYSAVDSQSFETTIAPGSRATQKRSRWSSNRFVRNSAFSQIADVTRRIWLFIFCTRRPDYSVSGGDDQFLRGPSRCRLCHFSKGEEVEARRWATRRVWLVAAFCASNQLGRASRGTPEVGELLTTPINLPSAVTTGPPEVPGSMGFSASRHKRPLGGAS